MPSTRIANYMNPEPTQDQELSDVMKQIAALTGSEQVQEHIIRNPEPQSQALSGAAGTLPSVPAATEAQSLPGVAPNTQPAPSAPVNYLKNGVLVSHTGQPITSGDVDAALRGPPLPQGPPRGTPNVLGDTQIHDVVQVNNRDSQHHGVFFAIGAIKDGWVHGYRLTEQGGKDFITVKTTEVHRIGPAKVRSQVPCSRQWIEQHGREK